MKFWLKNEKNLRIFKNFYSMGKVMFMNTFIHRLALLYNLKIFSISESCDDMVVDYECMCVCVWNY